MSNLKLNYRYRDAHNYKQFGYVIFSNSSKMKVVEATSLLLPKLISKDFFVPEDWGITRLHTDPYNPAVDHEWHEFEDFEETTCQASDKRDILQFVKTIKKGYEI
jgi:hypothetical protein